MPNKLLNELNEQVDDIKSHVNLSDTLNDHSIMVAGSALAIAIGIILLVTCLLLRYDKRKLRGLKSSAWAYKNQILPVI